MVFSLFLPIVFNPPTATVPPSALILSIALFRFLYLLSFCQQFLPTLSSSGVVVLQILDFPYEYYVRAVLLTFLFAAYLEPTKLYMLIRSLRFAISHSVSLCIGRAAMWMFMNTLCVCVCVLRNERVYRSIDSYIDIIYR